MRDLVAKARLAPSVHNIQPTRFRLAAPNRIELHEAADRRLPVADPSGHDVRISHGAALEGLVLALGGRGLRAAEVEVSARPGPGGAIASLSVTAGGVADPLQRCVASRASWRGAYAPLTPAAQAGLDRLSREDLVVVRGPDSVRALARAADEAGLHFVRQTDHRGELLRWMRLSRRHPDFSRDGLNADALALSGPEALGARWVLGALFRPLDAIGLAGRLTADAHAPGAAAFALFHRPEGEDAVASGRAFYRAWLEMEREGLAACPVSVLADHGPTNARLRREHGVPAGRRLVNAFKLGVPKGRPAASRARLPVDELILPS